MNVLIVIYFFCVSEETFSSRKKAFRFSTLKVDFDEEIESS